MLCHMLTSSSLQGALDRCVKPNDELRVQSRTKNTAKWATIYRIVRIEPSNDRLSDHSLSGKKIANLR